MSAGFAVVAASLLAGCGAASPEVGGEVPAAGPLVAIASYAGPEVYLVDPDTFELCGRVRLRSMGVDPTPLRGQRAFALALCGGVGVEADDAVALVRVSGPPRVDYVQLEHPNPGSVEVLDDDTLVVGHGWQDDGGWVFSLVDPLTRRLVREGRVREAAGPATVASGWVWTAGEAHADGRVELWRTSLDLSQSEPVGDSAHGGFVVLPDPAGVGSVLTVSSRPREATIERRDVATGATRASVTVTGVVDAIAGAATAAGTLVLVDASGANMARPGGPLIVLDATTFEERRRIDAGGSISSIGAWGARVLVTRWDTGELVEVDPTTGDVGRRLVLPDAGGVMLQLAVLDE